MTGLTNSARHAIIRVLNALKQLPAVARNAGRQLPRIDPLQETSANAILDSSMMALAIIALPVITRAKPARGLSNQIAFPAKVETSEKRTRLTQGSVDVMKGITHQQAKRPVSHAIELAFRAMGQITIIV